ncbi:mechanosensitive ion channel family protein [Halorubrum sp. BOL3-1]|uniref:mechanosensitive ion channel family protein n=1 Tax=Halorubrum sp. BOL3-1 TaxID=2497325 RepID=UPI00140D42BD|nr:mechanosensitive ion channel family protein [Halorubrum sp. BOL3-1]
MVGGSLLSESYLGSTIPQYLLFFAVLGLGALLGRSLAFLYRRRLKAKTEATETEIDDIIAHALGRPVILLGVVLAAVVGREVLTPVEPLRSVVNASVELPAIAAVAWIAVRLTDGLIQTYMVEYAERTESRLDDELVPIVSRVTNIAIVSIAVVVILDTIGYDVTTVIASIGVGGVALAFASRKTAADVFGGAHILTTKPFLVDDVVAVDDLEGTVEEIGLRSTRIRDFDGRVVTVPNATIADAEVTNVSSEPTRRVLTYLRLTYGTTPEEMESALELITETITAVDGVDADQTEAWFWGYDDDALRVRVEYHIADRERWKAVRDAVNRDLHAALDEAGIELGLPTRSVRLEGDDGDAFGVDADG